MLDKLRKNKPLCIAVGVVLLLVVIGIVIAFSMNRDSEGTKKKSTVSIEEDKTVKGEDVKVENDGPALEASEEDDGSEPRVDASGSWEEGGNADGKNDGTASSEQGSGSQTGNGDKQDGNSQDGGNGESQGSNNQNGGNESDGNTIVDDKVWDAPY